MDLYHYIATTAFGLEATVKREAAKLGLNDITVSDGKVYFTGTLEAIPKANLWMRSSDRILLVIGEFQADTFDELFEKTKALPWDDWIPIHGKFTVTGKSVRSQLHSVPDCQSIVKKAVVEKLKRKYEIDWFEETGPEYEIQASLLKNFVTLTIDTTGAGLHKRGYREKALAAPLKETLAAGMIELSYWKKNRTFMDPLCGSGSLPIECALMAKNIAPGLSRSFVSEQWPQLQPKLWKTVRSQAYAAIDVSFIPEIYASDQDPKAIELAKHNARKAGVDDCIRFETKALQNVALPGRYGIVICNPPYGQRLGSLVEVDQLYQDMGNFFRKDPTWSIYVITSHESFETLYGQKADKKRKLFNGMIQTNYYQFHGQKPSSHPNTAL